MPPVLSALVTLPFVLGKFAASSPLMGNDAYRIHLGLRTYFRALHHYLEIFIRPLDALNLAAFALIVVVLGVFAVWSRRPTLIFAWLFILITPLPVAFIGLRGGYAIYITTFGIAVFLAVSIIEFRNALARLAIGPCDSLALQTRRLLQFDTFVLCLLVLLVFYQSMPLSGASSDDNLIRSLVTQIGSAQPRIDSGWKILFLDDPFPNDYAVLFALRLYYRAPDLVVDRIKMMSEKPDKNQIDSYDCIFTFDGPRLVRVKP